MVSHGKGNRVRGVSRAAGSKGVDVIRKIRILLLPHLNVTGADKTIYMKRFLKGMCWTTGIFLLLWLILAQSCMTFRKSDADARKAFTAAGVTITLAKIIVDGRTIHYAMTGNDSFPTLFFIHGSPGSWDAFQEYMKDPDLLQKYRMVSVDRPGFGQSDYGSPEHLGRQSELISPLFTVLDNHRPKFLIGHSLGGPMVVKLAADNRGM